MEHDQYNYGRRITGNIVTITGASFVIFSIVTIILYYALPKKFQWCVLLLASVFFYSFVGVRSAIFVLITSISIYVGTRLMHALSLKRSAFVKENKKILSKEEISLYKKNNQRKRKLVMVLVLLLNLTILCVFKYFHFALEQVNGLLLLFGVKAIEDTYSFIVPLGISFYTFQSIGYLVDVYWEHYEPEKNYLKVLLFVSFFPQMTQGPISDFESLSSNLFATHDFSYEKFSYGAQRMVWGFAKKMLVADILAIYVNEIFANYESYSGLMALIGMFCYSVQIYADFSGYMDIMCGLCEILGINLKENFDRPYFSRSIAEYWRRWHITLGDWFKKYIYYPIAMSNWSRSFAKRTKDRFGKHFSNTLPATIALIVVWSATGLWHGASWKYITWGMVNGLFIILSLWLEPLFLKTKKALKINETNYVWIAFQMLRTFILVTFIKVLPEVGTLKRGLGLWAYVFTKSWANSDISSFVGDYAIAFFVAILMLLTSIIQYKKPMREYFNRIPYVLRLLIISVSIIFIIVIGESNSFVFGGGGFLYEGF